MMEICLTCHYKTALDTQHVMLIMFTSHGCQMLQNVITRVAFTGANPFGKPFGEDCLRKTMELAEKAGHFAKLPTSHGENKE